MKGYGISMFLFLLGFSVFIAVFSYADRQDSAQKVENIEKLYNLRNSLESNLDIKERRANIDSLQIKIDSLNAIK